MDQTRSSGASHGGIWGVWSPVFDSLRVFWRLSIGAKIKGFLFFGNLCFINFSVGSDQVHTILSPMLVISVSGHNVVAVWYMYSIYV